MINDFRKRICYKVNAEPVRVEMTDTTGNPVTQWLYVNCNPATFQIFGFINDTGVQTCRVGGGWGFIRSIQRVFYRGMSSRQMVLN